MEVRVSVVIPCYNSSAFLAETVQSVLDQTLSGIEIIFVDDGSVDDTAADIAHTITGSRIPARLICQANSGVASARNRGIAESRGGFVLPLDADDLIAPTMLEECFALLESDSQIDLVYTDRQDFGDIETIQTSGIFDLERLKYFNQLPYCTMYRKSLWEELGGYRNNVSGFDDWDFWIAAALRGCRAAHLAKPMLKHRRRRDSALWRTLERYEELFARIILNNPAAYNDSELDAARRFIEAGEPSPVIRASRFVFLNRYYEGYPWYSPRGLSPHDGAGTHS